MNADLFIRADGWMHRRDPRAKLGALLLCSIALMLVSRLWIMLFGLALIHLIALSTRVPARRLMQVWGTLWPVNLLVLLLASIVWGQAVGPTLVRFGPAHVTLASLTSAGMLAARVDMLAFAFLLLLWTTEQGALAAGLTRLGLPHGISLSIAIAMQFVPTFGRIFQEILEAQQSRGLLIPRHQPLAAARAYLPVLAPLLISALRMADNLSLALTARGYDPAVRPTCRRHLHIGYADGVLLLLSGALLAGAVWLT